ncbi:DUF4249 domain-containing protein [Sunxiuqinia rutila]|uniref:DUF4249 domain-containing protein n=1 Tax=Sunxiuqinia rutila TaxID=1397841 RepID=UPI003D36459B
MQRKWIYTFLFPIIFLVSCEKEVDLNLTVTEEQYALNSILEAGRDTIFLSATKVIPLSNTYVRIPISEATISLYRNDKKLGNMQHVDDGNYIFIHSVQAGDTYQLQAAIANKTLSAKTTVPPITEISYKVDTAKYITGPDGYLVTFKNIFIHDLPGLDQYWFYNLVKDRQGDLRKSTKIRATGVVLDHFNREFDPHGDLSEYLSDFDFYYALRIEDAGLDGKQLDFTIRGGEKSMNIVSHVDKHYDKYLKSVVSQKMIEDGELSIIEPIQIYSNITNGYGIFGSEAKTIVWF